MGRSWLGLLAAGVMALAPTTARAERVVFINADPVALTNAFGQDPTLDSYDTAGFTPGSVAGWPALTEAQRTELMYWLKESSIPFDIVFTWERPAFGPYDMLVMGTAADNAARFPGLGCSAAIGLADCSDENQDNVSFLFWGCMPVANQSDMHRVAFTAMTALGFGWGLENLDTTGQILGSYTANGLHFGSACVAVSDGTCDDHIGCVASQQNSTSDLDARIGPRVDDGPPVVAITSPTMGAMVGNDFEVTADVTDQFGGLEVTLTVVEAAQSLADPMPPYQWDLNAVPAGMWTLEVAATDADGNVVSSQVTVCIDDCAGATDDGAVDESGGDPDTGAGGTSSGGADESTGAPSDDGSTSVAGTSSDGGDDGSGGGGSDPTLPANPTGFGGEDAAAGCQCRAAAPSFPSVWLLLVALGLRRRVTRRG